MADAPEVEKPSEVERPALVTPTMARSEHYVSIYANQVEIGYSAWDIQFSIMQVHGRIADLAGLELASVIMSPQHAKAMVIPLMNTIIEYEKVHGVVQIPGQTEPISLANMITRAVDKKREVEAAAAAEAEKETE